MERTFKQRWARTAWDPKTTLSYSPYRTDLDTNALVMRVDLTTFTQSGTLSLSADESNLYSAVVSGNFAYFAWVTLPMEYGKEYWLGFGVVNPYFPSRVQRLNVPWEGDQDKLIGLFSCRRRRVPDGPEWACFSCCEREPRILWVKRCFWGGNKAINDTASTHILFATQHLNFPNRHRCAGRP